MYSHRQLLQWMAVETEGGSRHGVSDARRIDLVEKGHAEAGLGEDLQIMRCRISHNPYEDRHQPYPLSYDLHHSLDHPHPSSLLLVFYAPRFQSPRFPVH